MIIRERCTMKNINGKGQAAIEFLVTYGWAIMAAMIVIGALTYFGMINPASSLPDKCTFSNAFECKDYQINGTALKLKVTNSFGQTIYNLTANCTDNEAIGCSIGGAASLASVDPEGVIEIICNNPPDSPFNIKEKAKVKVTIKYFKSPSGGYSQVSLGEVYAIAQ
jgi:hypothetical protein